MSVSETGDRRFNPDKDEPFSLHPLAPEEALQALLGVGNGDDAGDDEGEPPPD